MIKTRKIKVKSIENEETIMAMTMTKTIINKMLYGGANFVPIAVPRFCLSVFFPNVNMLFFNTTSAKSRRRDNKRI